MRTSNNPPWYNTNIVKLKKQKPTQDSVIRELPQIIERMQSLGYKNYLICKTILAVDPKKL